MPSRFRRRRQPGLVSPSRSWPPELRSTWQIRHEKSGPSARRTSSPRVDRSDGERLEAVGRRLWLWPVGRKERCELLADVSSNAPRALRIVPRLRRYFVDEGVVRHRPSRRVSARRKPPRGTGSRGCAFRRGLVVDYCFTHNWLTLVRRAAARWPLDPRWEKRCPDRLGRYSSGWRGCSGSGSPAHRGADAVPVWPPNLSAPPALQGAGSYFSSSSSPSAASRSFFVRVEYPPTPGHDY